MAVRFAPSLMSRIDRSSGQYCARIPGRTRSGLAPVASIEIPAVPMSPAQIAASAIRPLKKLATVVLPLRRAPRSVTVIEGNVVVCAAVLVCVPSR